MTTTTTNDLRHVFTLTRGKEKTVIKIKLNDRYRNGHEMFSLTADIYEKTPRGWRDVGGGCCHEHILKLKPELAPFEALHLSDVEGVPMHAASNAWHWFQGAFPEAADSPYHGGTGSSGKPPMECRRIFADYIRATPEQVEQIAALMPRSQAELRAVLEDLGFPEQWKREAQAAIRQLEEWSGSTFESRATRKSWEPLPVEVRQDITQKRASGYYTPEAVAKRDAEAKEAAKQKKLASLRASHEAACDKLKRCLDVEVHLVELFGPQKLNLIYYDHCNELEANWTNTEKLITKPEFDAITQALDYSKLPQGIKTVWKERPRY